MPIAAIVHVLLVVVFCIWFLLAMSSKLTTNVGWIYLTRAILDLSASETHLDKANEWFAQGIASRDDSAQIGANIVAVLQQAEDRPDNIWSHDPKAAGHFTALADYFAGQNDLEYAASLFSRAAEARTSDIEYNVNLGRFCQRHRDVLNDDFPKAREHCHEWLRRNQDNWLTNPYFEKPYAEDQDVPGWALTPSSKQMVAELAVVAAPTPPDSILTMDSDTTMEESNSFCQRIVLTPKEVVEFSAAIETQPVAQDAMEARILYIGWRDAQDRSQGNQKLKIADARPETSYRRQFVLPEGASPNVLFCPVVLSGQGSVSLSNVRVQSLGIEP